MTALSPLGYMNDPKTYDEFQQQVSVSTDAKNGACWALGDLYNYGKDHFEETFADAFSDTLVQLVTIQNYASVCRKFPRQRRRKWQTLSFSHYDVVKAMDEAAQDDLLTQAELNQWNRGDLRDAKMSYEGIPKPTSIKGTVKVRDILEFLTKDKGLDGNDIIDFTAKLAELEAVA